MADIKLNEVSALTDFDYALVVKGTQVAKVTKADLAAVVGELMGATPTFKINIGSSNGTRYMSVDKDCTFIAIAIGSMSNAYAVALCSKQFEKYYVNTLHTSGGLNVVKADNDKSVIISSNGVWHSAYIMSFDKVIPSFFNAKPL